MTGEVQEATLGTCTRSEQVEEVEVAGNGAEELTGAERGTSVATANWCTPVRFLPRGGRLRRGGDDARKNASRRWPERRNR